MPESVRSAGITILVGLTVAWMIGFIAMFFRPNQNAICWVGLAGGAVLIVMIFRLLIKDN